MYNITCIWKHSKLEELKIDLIRKKEIGNDKKVWYNKTVKQGVKTPTEITKFEE